MKIYAIIPARGGSKGVPGKNIKDLCNKPLIAWTIAEAQKSKYISRVIVNTDSCDIAHVARIWHAEVFWRSLDFGNDSVSDLEVFTEHLSKLREMNDLPDMVVDLRATAPLRKADRIDQGIELLMKAGKKNADAVRAVTLAQKHPAKMWRLSPEGSLNPFVEKSFWGVKESQDAPRQALPPIYQNNGCVNAFWPETVLQKHSTVGDRVLGFEMQSWESVNIDTEFDFQYAEYLMKKHNIK